MIIKKIIAFADPSLMVPFRTMVRVEVSELYKIGKVKTRVVLNPEDD